MADNPPDLCLLVLADMHYVHHAGPYEGVPERRTELGRELVRRVCDRAAQLADLDAVLVMGDLVDDGTKPGAAQDLAELQGELARPGLPVVVVRGNHDAALPVTGAPGETVQRITLGGYQLLVFSDPYAADDTMTRGAEALQAVRDLAPDLPVLALQHNPLNPPIVSDYPFMPTNRDEIMAAYQEAGVLLSISGHYHPSQPVSREGGVAYVTAPALCEHPFRFLIVRGRGREIEIEEHRLALSDDRATPSPYVDFHCHTEFAYCRDDITAEEAVSRADEFGVRKLYLTEHSGQLYLGEEDYWAAAYLADPGIVARERRAGRGRMDAYRARVEPLRSERVGVGLEVEVDGAGGLTLLPEDAGGWDVLVGAVHVTPECLSARPDQARVEAEFLRFTEILVRSEVDILAHPFRLFRRAGLRVPEELFAPVAELLAEGGVAAEINFHTNEESPEFVAMCVERGVKLALGSDAHGLWEVGALWSHLDLLARLSAPPEAVLYSLSS
jgi:histidinol phosphatase-like PHP family hydrolase/predicted phosphodiesterase